MILICFIKRLLFIFICFFSFSNYSIIFLNKYIIPELCQIPILSYRNLFQTLEFQPFVISANSAHQNNCFNSTNGSRGIYEIDGYLFLNELNKEIEIINKTISNGFPSEWIAAGLEIPTRLLGNIGGSGIGWTFSHELTKHIVIGWSSALCMMSGILNIKPTSESQNYPLKEGLLFDIFQSYRNLTKKINLSGTYSHYTGFADQDVYLRVEYITDFIARMRRIKLIGQIGCIIPTTPCENIYNPSSFPVGTNGFWAYYFAGQIDLLLKEDIIFGMLGKIYYEVPETKAIRAPIKNTSSKYGAWQGNININPGLTIMFNPYISIEGLQRGLGFKIGYSVWDHFSDKLNNIPGQELGFNFDFYGMQNISGWAQEHCTIIVFYDFMREKEIHDMEPFLGFSVQIPVDFFFSHQSAKSYGVSFILETLY